jgi:hypothetical protein
MRWILAVSICVLVACRHPMYTLARQGRTPILTPPARKPEIKNARSHPEAKTGCDVTAGPFSLTWRGNTARVSAKTEEYFAPPAGEVAQPSPAGVAIRETGPRMYKDSLADIDKFREAIAAKAQVGCLRMEDAARLEGSITETLPFPPQIAAYLRFGVFLQTGFVDLGEGSLLSVLSPVENSFDISLYAAQKGEAGRVRIAQISGAGKALALPDAALYFRYVYWTGASAHNFRATILGADQRPALAAATAKFLDDPEGYCAGPATGVFCQTIGPQAGMNAGFYVKVNGVDTFARVGGTVGEALTDPKKPRQQITVKSVRRLYRGKYIPVTFEGNEILGLVVQPGDDIRQ